ncbi:protein-L-isoaspartate O-methyltransferase [Terrihabitans soli]|uniref:Protein-L-isoaspartate O-methyltransferase n=2 Tax=Terrihabitans soli TaxID=708113 RepID=A0A6S6QTV8_9HYPH|nr:protein-L-isoaspartate O-methyltransferase [Terrihabitans soli]
MGMFDFKAARAFMVEGQIRTNDVTDPRITGAMFELERERFVPASLKTLAYSDKQIPVSEGSQRLMPAPIVTARLIRTADIKASDYVLHIGCSTGYGTAILAKIANSVVALEEDAGLAKAASENLSALGINNVAVVTGPLAKGYPAEGPYDVIVIEGAIETLPDTLSNQLKEDGRLVSIIGTGRTGRGTLFRKTPKGLSGFPFFDAAAPLLPGFVKPPAFTF